VNTRQKELDATIPPDKTVCDGCGKIFPIADLDQSENEEECDIDLCPHCRKEPQS
jgi:hypothetical protein